MSKIAGAAETAERPTPVQKQKRKPSPWETAPDFSSLIGQLVPKQIARTAPTAPMPGNAPRPVAPASIEEAVLALATQMGAAALPEAPAPAAAQADEAGEALELPAVEIPTEAHALDVSELPPVEDELPSDEIVELAKQAVSQSAAPLPDLQAAPPPEMPALPAVELLVRPPPSVPPPLPALSPPPVMAASSLDFDEDFLPVREAHFGRTSASITVGEGADQISLKITADSQDVKVHAVVATAETAQQLQRGAGELAQELARHGLNLSGLSADASGTGRHQGEAGEPGDAESVESLSDLESPFIDAGVRAVI
jgi:Flagellar hook-length control protein FliK